MNGAIGRIPIIIGGDDFSLTCNNIPYALAVPHGILSFFLGQNVDTEKLHAHPTFSIATLSRRFLHHLLASVKLTASQKAGESKEKAEEAKQKAYQSTEETKDKTSPKMKEALEKAYQAALEAKDKAYQNLSGAKEKASQKKEHASQEAYKKGQEAYDEACRKVEEAKEVAGALELGQGENQRGG
ncbi:hypothetical protein RHSIM_RhsimUnG0146500 [Rhododendron simsii]|uniref:Uncharacterized protein n=1 Tax=Rhododendron simsii TaxID=118357 RepID=A0A834FVI5_RHOSS|nr:hypothetical protein RHSIM_RhsimUnG0146500 [Rhododendron simsii]